MKPFRLHQHDQTELKEKGKGSTIVAEECKGGFFSIEFIMVSLLSFGRFRFTFLLVSFRKI